MNVAEAVASLSDALETQEEPVGSAVDALEISRLAADAAGAMAEGDYARAIQIHRKRIDLHPADASAWAGLAKSLAALGWTDQAVTAYASAAEIDPAVPDYPFAAGKALAKAARFADAATWLKKAAALAPHSVEVLAELGRVQQLANDPAGACAAFRRAAELRPGDAKRSIDLADALLACGDVQSAVVAAANAVRLSPESAESRMAAGRAALADARTGDAVSWFEKALAAEPLGVRAMSALSVALARQDRTAEAVALAEHALALHRARPGFWNPDYPREFAGLALAAETPSPAEATDVRRFAVLLGCYGNFPDYSIRAMESLTAGRDLSDHCDIYIGLNACGDRTVAHARALADAGIVAGVVESRSNRNKDPMLRLLLEMAGDAPYILWMDDDSHFVDRSWPAQLHNFFQAEHPFDVAGMHARWGPRRDLDPPYVELAKSRSWFRGFADQPQDLLEWLPFVVGGMFVARTEFLRRHNFPDRRMVKALDDVLLGELLQQVGGRLVAMPPTLLSLIRINEGQRRGENFLIAGGSSNY
jgi:tetratricopeptide (TPR) repeat protein